MSSWTNQIQFVATGSFAHCRREFSALVCLSLGRRECNQYYSGSRYDTIRYIESNRYIKIEPIYRSNSEPHYSQLFRLFTLEFSSFEFGDCSTFMW